MMLLFCVVFHCVRCDGLLFTLSEEPSTHLGTLPSAHSEWIRACCYNKTVSIEIPSYQFSIICVYTVYYTSIIHTR